MINNLFIFGVHLINLFNYLSLNLNLKQLNTVTLPLLLRGVKWVGPARAQQARLHKWVSPTRLNL